MWKFKASKYKNASPKFLKKEEWLSEIPVGSVMPSCGNHVAASCTHMAFSIESGGGGNIAVLPLETRGRQGAHVPVIQAHSDYVTDFQFSPFDDHLLMSGSQDLTVRLWRLPDGALSDNICTPEMTLTQEERRVENVLWHPTAENGLAISCFKSVKLFDVNTKSVIFSKEIHGDQVQSISWKADGTCFATSGKDKKLKIVDPRANSIVQEAAGHANIKDSRILWLGNRDQVVTTGFDMMRSRELALRDIRNLGSTLRCVNFDTSTGVFMPFYDPDTNMLFVGGKGDTCVRFVEITDKDPYITDGITDPVEQIKGLALVPKRALDVIQCEVNRLLLLMKSGVIPVPYCVPRKSYNEYHEDLFPDTAGPEAAMTVTEWLQGSNKEVPKVSLNPSKKSKSGTPKKASAASSSYTPSPAASGLTPAPATTLKPSLSPKPKRSEPTPEPQTEIERVRAAMGQSNISNGSPGAPSPSFKRSTVFAGMHQSKCRHLEGAVLSHQLHITNVRNVSTSIPGESDFFHANKERCAIPQGGAGGLIAVLELSNAGRLPDTGVPVVQNGALLMDFKWDPFDTYRLAAACDDAKIRIWDLPIEGLTETITEPDILLKGHTEKIYFIQFHPLAKDVLASASYDMTVRIWDLATQEEKIQLTGHTDTIFCAAWSMDGKKLATVCKDGKIRLYDPRQSDKPISEGAGPEGSRGARCVWVCQDKYLVVCGFDKMTHRQISIYQMSRLKEPLKMIELDVSPSILIPHYDADTSTLFVTGRGDGIVHAYEITEKAPYFHELSSFKGDGLHQAVSFLAKIECDVRKVEFAKAWRLTMHTVEPVSFTVPRIKTEYFQDDLFPDTRVTWNPVLTSSEWFSGMNKLPKTVSLRPHDMKLLSDAPVVAPKPRKYESYNPETFKTDEQKKEELLSAMSGKLDLSNEPLPQDLTEGVDDDEWDD